MKGLDGPGAGLFVGVARHCDWIGQRMQSKCQDRDRNATWEIFTLPRKKNRDLHAIWHCLG